ncbi:M6 family metalloprotease domain-containing protein [Xylanibacter caecicola]|uniref:M6 family metalloprotease domain-containing protein n=1 Tax=Xylanibacter caecicola TaxID=2736294 RepID=UPI002584FDAD|nr:M6 family metalloprotease domain-containing protein [Xylanibacter caecicola]
MNRLFLSISLLFVMLGASAVPAKRGIWRTLPLVGGGEVHAELIGDECLNYYKSAAGTFYVPVADGFYDVADIASLKAAAGEKRAVSDERRLRRGAKARAGARVGGTVKGLVILVEFKDTKFSSDNAQPLYNDILNAENYKNDKGFVGSVRDYFRDQSNGRLLIDFDVTGPVQMPNGYAYYGANTGLLGSDAHPDEMVEYACKAVADKVNFADYDWDGDGEADQVCIIYAGRGEASGGDANTIWPHEGQLTRYGKDVMIDGVKVDTYALSCELGEKGTIDGIGTFCHEFSHCLGIPDMYDTSNSGGYGMYRWDIMSYGNYNGDSFVPAAYTSYERWLAGWIEPVELKEDTDISGMKSLEEGGTAYIIYNDGDRNEYYLLENRRKTGWDAALPGEGLLVIHVDYDAKVWAENTVNSSKGSHPHLSPIAADNSYVSEDADCAGDVFPYNGNNSLTNTTTPAATLYNKNTDGSYFMNKSVEDITKNEDGTMSFAFRVVDEKPQPDVEGNWFYESFDKCAGIGGNDGKWGNASTGGFPQDFLTDNAGWESDNANNLRPADKCAKFTGGTVKSPMFYFDNGAVITFKAAPCNGYAETLTLGTDRGTLGQTTFTMTNGAWTEFKTTLSGEGYTQLSFTTGDPFFVDELRVNTPSATGIDHVVAPSASAGKRIYSIDGRYMGTDIDVLAKGLYIVGGRKVVK